MAGISCHYMVKWMDRNTETFTHMGREGVAWIGQSAFSYMAPPMISKKDALTGHLIKRSLPGFLIKIFPLIAKLKALRGGAFDPFGKTRERKIERQLIDQFSADIRTVASHFSQKHLSEKYYKLCVQFAAAPMKIKGFGHIKTSNIDLYKQTRKTVLQQLDC